MTEKQRCVVYLGFVVILLMGLFPPWTEPPMSPRGFDGYSFLLGHSDAPPVWETSNRVDTSLLLVQWFLVAATTGVVVMFMGKPRKKTD